MGGDTTSCFSDLTSGEDDFERESLPDQQQQLQLFNLSSSLIPTYLSTSSGLNLLGDDTSAEYSLVSKETGRTRLEHWFKSSLDSEANQRRLIAYKKLLKSYDELKLSSKNLEEAKGKILRKSDSSSLKTRMNCKARQSGYSSSMLKKVNFAIFVVDGLEVLRSMDNDGCAENQYICSIKESFNCPYLSFKDDKPVVVVTHGDLLSPTDNALVRLYLGELLGVPPDKQIFDIPESIDPVTELAIVDLLRYSLEHADRNLPLKVRRISWKACIWLLLMLGIFIISFHMSSPYLKQSVSSSYEDWTHKSKTQEELTCGSNKEDHVDLPLEWHKIRYLWLGDN